MTDISYTWSPSSDRAAKEESLFDPDTKDSGFQEEEDPGKSPTAPMSPTDQASNHLSFDDEYAQFKCLVDTPKVKAHSKRRLCFLNSPEEVQKRATTPKQFLDSPVTLLSDLSVRLSVVGDDSDEEQKGGLNRIFHSEGLPRHVQAIAIERGPNSTASNENHHHHDRQQQQQQQQDLVKEAVEKSQDGNLIGDFSKNYALPSINGSHPDLRCISASTLRDVLDGTFSETLDSVTVVDSRYPYEYRGGHVRGAINVYTMKGCEALLKRPSRPSNERHILIFHCEFSKERGPKLMRHLRKTDRSINSTDYPSLTFPELYLLEGGYKKFYEQFPDHCEPKDYRQMLHPEHAEEMRLFRRKCKSEDALRPVHSTKTLRRTESETVRKLDSEFFDFQF